MIVHPIENIANPAVPIHVFETNLVKKFVAKVNRSGDSDRQTLAANELLAGCGVIKDDDLSKTDNDLFTYLNHDKTTQKSLHYNKIPHDAFERDMELLRSLLNRDAATITRTLSKRGSHVTSKQWNDLYDSIFNQWNYGTTTPEKPSAFTVGIALEFKDKISPRILKELKAQSAEKQT